MSGFKATMVNQLADGSWMVRYFDTPKSLPDAPCRVTRHLFRWTARLASRRFMNGRGSWWRA